mmetsp:Transcript_3399/g.6503  ORF Transcript_3399/g.6503 Transcript_3399/m.6503 type:complete len:397 (-) Transcript_3399:1624-2814(-)|eukprot:CAMPEP_0203755644 /NCGR_PEP_ID=MMETSP0098-20131031/9061_1 /ASSEMBLY_ACC=CAM_ASM_000208 /TAXON_ID=96639 /ORGANISM=" , Strain NY0313808BC1" /LENGTH=396 /DNA_ID=CAMNT_0050647199 /DNA_START=260 /DNA_END=1450 /DNA_ORIENTATION=+
MSQLSELEKSILQDSSDESDDEILDIRLPPKKPTASKLTPEKLKVVGGSSQSTVSPGGSSGRSESSDDERNVQRSSRKRIRPKQKKCEEALRILNETLPEEMFWATGFYGCNKIYYPCRLIRDVSLIDKATKQEMEEGLLHGEGELVAFFSKGERVYFDRLPIEKLNEYKFVPDDENYNRLAKQPKRKSLKSSKRNISLLGGLKYAVKIATNVYEKGVALKKQQEETEAVLIKKQKRDVEKAEQAIQSKPVTPQVKPREHVILNEKNPEFTTLRPGDFIAIHENGYGIVKRRIMEISTSESCKAFPVEVDQLVAGSTMIHKEKMVCKVLSPEMVKRAKVVEELDSKKDYFSVRKSVEDFKLEDGKCSDGKTFAENLKSDFNKIKQDLRSKYGEMVS